MIPGVTYILAANYMDFRRVCEQSGIDFRTADYLVDAQDLAGKRIGSALATAAWMENPKYDWDFIDHLKTCCRMIFVEGDLP